MRTDEPSPPPRVLVAVPTFRRPRSLRLALESIGRQQLDPEEAALTVVIVDNDAHGSAHSVFEALSHRYPHGLMYVSEPRRGISHARNRALDLLAREPGWDFLVFMDDDECADTCWIRELLCAQRRHRADMVTGPVTRMFPVSAPAWAGDASIFQVHCYRDGERLATAATGNVLIRADALRGSGLRFDERMALTGGEDELFFLQWGRLGYSMVWHNGARVTEYVHPSRLTPGWVARRSLCYGNAVTRLHFIFRPPFQAVAFLVAFSGYQNVRAFRQTLRWLKGERGHLWIDLVQYASAQIGVLIGLCGITLKNYVRIQGE